MGIHRKTSQSYKFSAKSKKTKTLTTMANVAAMRKQASTASTEALALKEQAGQKLLETISTSCDPSLRPIGVLLSDAQFREEQGEEDCKQLDQASLQVDITPQAMQGFCVNATVKKPQELQNSQQIQVQVLPPKIKSCPYCEALECDTDWTTTQISRQIRLI